MNMFEMFNGQLSDNRGCSFFETVNKHLNEAEKVLGSERYFVNSKKYFFEFLEKDYKDFAKELDNSLKGFTDEKKLNSIFDNYLLFFENAVELEDVDLFFDSIYDLLNNLPRKINNAKGLNGIQIEISSSVTRVINSMKVSLPESRLLYL